MCAIDRMIGDVVWLIVVLMALSEVIMLLTGHYCASNGLMCDNPPYMSAVWVILAL